MPRKGPELAAAGGDRETCLSVGGSEKFRGLAAVLRYLQAPRYLPSMVLLMFICRPPASMVPFCFIV